LKSVKSSHKFLFFLFLAFIFQSCALTNSQFKTAKQFYSSVNNFDKQCHTLKESSFKITYERRLLFPITYNNDSLMVNELVANYEENVIAQYKKDSIDNAINKIGNYFNSYVSLLPKSSENKGTNRRVLAAIEDYSSYLPFGIGLTIYKTVYDVINYTSRFIKIPHQRKKYKTYITKGEKLVPDNLNIISKEFSKSSLMLDSEKVLIKQNYLLLLQAQKVNKNPYDYYSVYNVNFLKNYNLAILISELNKSMLESISKINASYTMLYNETRNRKRFKNDIIGLSQMNSKLGKTKLFNKKVEETIK